VCCNPAVASAAGNRQLHGTDKADNDQHYGYGHGGYGGYGGYGGGWGGGWGGGYGGYGGGYNNWGECWSRLLLHHPLLVLIQYVTVKASQHN
jgi:hypothetical protein